MGLTLTEIKQTLTPDGLRGSALQAHAETPLTEVKLLTYNQTHFHPQTVYVGTNRFIKQHALDLSGAHLIVIDDGDVLDPLDLSMAQRYLLLDESCDLFETFNRINQLFHNESKLEAIRASDNLDHIATRGADLLTNPVIFIDSGYRVLAHASPTPIQDPIWQANVARGYCSYEFISYVRNMPDLKSAGNDATPFRLQCVQSEIDKYATQLFVRGKVIGYLIVLVEDSPFQAAEQELTRQLARIGAAYYERHLSKRNLDHLGYENVLIDLLDEKITDSDTLTGQMTLYGEQFQEHKVILLLDITAFNAQAKPAGYLSTEIERLLNKRHLYYDEQVVVLYDFSEEAFPDTEQINRLKAFAHTHHLVIGVSQMFSDLIEVRRHYLEAKQVLTLHEHMPLSGPLRHFKDIAFYVLLAELTQRGTDLTDYVHPSIAILDAYDKANQTDLSLTLVTYLQANQNAVVTGDALFLHRNTVKYRLDQIIALTHLDLTDADDVFNVLYSYRIQTYLTQRTAH